MYFFSPTKAVVTSYTFSIPLGMRDPLKKPEMILMQQVSKTGMSPTMPMVRLIGVKLIIQIKYVAMR